MSSSTGRRRDTPIERATAGDGTPAEKSTPQGRNQMSRILKCAAIAGATLMCSAAPALADDEYTTEQVAPAWTAGSTESCTDPDVAPVLSGFKDDDFYAVAPGGDFEGGAGGWQLDGGASVVSAGGGLGVLGASSGALE